MKSFLWMVAIAVLSASLARCASVPDTDGARPPSASQVRVSTDKGWLSYRTSRQLIQRLGDSARGADFLAAHLKVEEAVSGAPLTGGNQVEIYDDGPQTYEAMFEAIRAARSYIHLESYIFEDDEVGRKLARMLADKRAEDVAVAVMVDGVGTLGTSPELFDTMRDAGIQVMIFNPVNPLIARSPSWSINQRNHRKILVVDGKVGFTGGINMSNVYSSSPSSGSRASAGSASSHEQDSRDIPWRDTHIRIAGPAAGELEKVFQRGWREQNGPPLLPRDFFPDVQGEGRQFVRIVANDPNDERGYTVYLTLMSAISSAQQSIGITMAYFVPDPAFIEALKEAAARGVDVELVLPAVSDSSLVLHAGRSHYTDLLQAGVKIYERTGALLHAKTAVVDGVWSTVGSSNLDWRSFTLNYEVNAVILGAEFGSQMRRLFDDDVRQSKAVTLAEWRERGVWARFMELIGRLGERWL